MLLFSGKKTSLYAIAAHYVDVRRTSLKALALCKLQEMYNKPQSLFVSPLLQTELDFSRKKHCMLVLRIMVTSQKPVLKPLLLIPQNHEYDSENYIAPCPICFAISKNVDYCSES